MKLASVEVKDFRCYKEVHLNLHPEVTVLVANNGQGKTALLDAVRIGLWPFVSSFDLAKSAYADPANTIRVADVLMIKSENGMARQLPAEVVLNGDYGLGIKQWRRFRDSEAPSSKTKDDRNTKELKEYASALQEKVRDVLSTPESLPVFGYYGTGRLWKEKRLTESKRGSDNRKTDEDIRTFAYRDSLDPASSYKQFVDWFISAFKKIREEQIKQLEAGESSIKADPKVENPVTVIQNAVNELLKNTGWQNISYSETLDKSLVLEHSEKGTLKVDQLSDGIKNMIAMIADIAYRCALLNGHLGSEAAKKSDGLVMIDEVDMHLHPEWQQTVVGSLTAAFPKIQFIVTTHSPQVLSTVPTECIRVIENGEVHRAPMGSKGAESSRLLKRIFGVATRPQDDENTKLLIAYEKLVYADKWNTGEAEEKRKKLDEIFGGEEPKLTELDLYIENRSWEIAIEKNQ